MSDSKVNIFSLLLLIGAIIGLVSIFVTWTDYLGQGLLTATGWDYVDNGFRFGFDHLEDVSVLLALMASVITIICGSLAVILRKKIFGTVGAVFGFLMILASLLFIVGLTNTGVVLDWINIGVFLMMVAGIISTVGGAAFKPGKT
jgi:hypothetical protein